MTPAKGFEVVHQGRIVATLPTFREVERYLYRLPWQTWGKFAVYEVEQGYWWLVDDFLEGRAGEGAGEDE